jgi:hypothetical protein
MEMQQKHFSVFLLVISGMQGRSLTLDISFFQPRRHPFSGASVALP